MIQLGIIAPVDVGYFVSNCHCTLYACETFTTPKELAGTASGLAKTFVTILGDVGILLQALPLPLPQRCGGRTSAYNKYISLLCGSLALPLLWYLNRIQRMEDYR